MKNKKLLEIKKIFKKFFSIKSWKKLIFSAFNVKKNIILRVV
ncbi:hypothetical protein CWS_00575 [Buchnera aphidicola str. JF99 (Acyrthosiphon pisum)]|nr:hypothetical protein CWO_00555 [Buchnera aphidicola str. LL01 (Acyrthosiphon pisum)]ADP66509.1 hypothetical protein CWQ_00605 [Buchnera aphidicola str. TLW03 (Acyrthosiphon pisum)]ADP67090.1 hypothetical protein CWS_00575 [Buchnera aphidicola str. JF99 (Acyrthosiphon pisum)]ADP67660.1 hypothetical protein CWU_00705 [Buchnera aphidicola str. JF98 (Acyrthosiphon pisum)]